MTAYNAVMTKANKKTAPHRVRATAQFMWEQRGVIPRPERNAKILVSVGDALLNCVREATGLFHIERVRKGKGKTAQFIYTLVARAEYVTYMEDTLRLDQENGALHLPMTLKPLPWSQGRRGGYLSDFIPNTELVKTRNKVSDFIPNAELVKTRNKEQRKRLNLVDMPIVYEAANKAQGATYRVNERIRTIMAVATEDNVELGKMPRLEDYSLPIPPAAEDIDGAVLIE
jgi:DNA-directed RNA polymerase